MTSVVLPRPVVGLRDITQRTIDSATRKSHQIDSAKAHMAALVFLPSVANLFSMGGLLVKLNSWLNSPEIDAIPVPEMRQVSHECSQLVGRLYKICKTYDEFGISQMWPYRYLVNRLRLNTDHLASIVEGFLLSMNAEFGELMSDAARELRENKQTARSENHCCPSAR